jgi:hypothetical protein
MRRKSLFAQVILGVVCCVAILAATPATARIWNVPEDVGSVGHAIDLARSGDEIVVAVGHWKVASRDHVIHPGVTIRGAFDMPGAVILEETPCVCDEWRDHPVFRIEEAGAPVRIENVTFSGFQLSHGPFPAISNPIFHVAAGQVQFRNVVFDGFYKYALYINGSGSATIQDCVFQGGRGCPSAVYFDGVRLGVRDTIFRNNAWMDDCGEYRGVVVRLVGGSTSMYNVDFVDNGPVFHVLRIEENAHLEGTCVHVEQNMTLWDGHVAGVAIMEFCHLDQDRWIVEDVGVLRILGQLSKSMAVEAWNFSAVRALFD